MKGKIKTSSYRLLSELALLVECLAPGQNCITCIIYTKGKSLREKETNTLFLYSWATWELYDMTWLYWNTKKKGRTEEAFLN